MKPTIEEVKRVSAECTVKTKHSGFNAGRLMTYEELQAFAQHWMEAQRKSDAKIAMDKTESIRKANTTKKGIVQHAAVFASEMCEDVCVSIRNNTGE